MGETSANPFTDNDERAKYIDSTRTREYAKFNQYFEQNDAWNALLSYNKFRGLGGRLNLFDLDRFYRLVSTNPQLSLVKYLSHLDSIDRFLEIEQRIAQIYILYSSREFSKLKAVAGNLSDSHLTQLHNIGSIAMFEAYEDEQAFHSECDCLTSQACERMIHLSSVFYYGRIGHALNDYIIMSLVASKFDAKLTIGDWCLPKVLTINNSQSGQPLPIVRKSPDEFIASYIYGDKSIALNHDYFSPQVSAKKLPDKGPVSKESYLKFVANTLHFQERYICVLGNQLNNYAKGRQVVAIHVRMGDGQNRFETLSSSRIADLIARNESLHSERLLYLCSDEPEKVQSAFGEFCVHTRKDIFSDNIPGWAQDLFVLAHADVIFLSQSSFSVVGAMLNRKTPIVYEQNIEDNQYDLLNGSVIDIAEAV